MKKKLEKLEAVKLYKPSNLNLECIVVDGRKYFALKRKNNEKESLVEVSGKVIQNSIPALYYIIHTLIERQHSGNEAFQFVLKKKIEDEEKESTYCRMYVRDIEVLKSKSDFGYMMSLLRNMNIVDVETRIEKTKQKGSSLAYYFKLKEPYEDAVIVEHEIQVFKSQAVKVNKKLSGTIIATGSMKEQLVLANSVLKHQLDSIQHVNFNVQDAITYVMDSYKNGDITIGKFNACYFAVNQIVNQRITFSVSPNCDRVYTNVTCMPKLIRPYIYDRNGHSMVELDFGAFNAFALYAFLIKKNVANEIPLQGEELVRFKNEVKEYGYLLQGNDFYATLMRNPHININNRSDFKKKFLKDWLNAKIKNKSTFRKSMESVFPMISKVLTAFKTNNYKQYTNTFMKMESELVNHTIYKQFVEKYPDALIYTIFDCVLIEFQYSKILFKMMMDEGSKFFGVAPKVSIKCHDPKHEKQIDRIRGNNQNGDGLTDEQKEALQWHEYYEKMNMLSGGWVA